MKLTDRFQCIFAFSFFVFMHLVQTDDLEGEFLELRRTKLELFIFLLLDRLPLCTDSVVREFLGITSEVEAQLQAGETNS